MSGAVMKASAAIALVACAAVLVACPKKEESADAGATASPSASARAGADAGDGAAVTTDGKALVRQACLSCHTEQMLDQQRLTEAQWQKTVVKMTLWGANLDPNEVAPLVAYLSATYGPDAGPYVAETISAKDALAELAPTPDAPFPTGDAERGKALFVDKCSTCHGKDARGAIGVCLVDKPFLYRAADFASTVRHGRGKMVPLPLTDAEIGDVLAHLRRLKSPPLP